MLIEGAVINAVIALDKGCGSRSNQILKTILYLESRTIRRVSRRLQLIIVV